MTRTVSVFVALVLTGCALTAAHAASRGDGFPRSAAGVKWGKLSSELAQVLRAERSEGRGLAVARRTGLTVVGGRVRVVVEARSSRAAAASVVVAVQGRVEASHADLVQALVAPAALARLSSATAVAYVRTPRRAAILG